MLTKEKCILELNEFRKLSQHVEENYGIQLPITKKTMVESRLQKRVRHLQLPSFKAYFEHAFSQEGQKAEYFIMIDCLTTNKTEFFREAAHFEFLRKVALPTTIAMKNPNRPLHIWSAACSSGEEVYSIIMALEEFIGPTKSLPYRIFGSDLSITILKRAINAVYSKNNVINLNEHQMKKFFLKSKDVESDLIRFKKEYRQKAYFERVNLLEDIHNIKAQFDIIFCRNVLIYFNKETQYQVIRGLLEKLTPGGFLMIGHSESLAGLNLPLKQVQPTVYQRI